VTTGLPYWKILLTGRDIVIAVVHIKIPWIKKIKIRAKWL
jgi:hypothetical protein